MRKAYNIDLDIKFNCDNDPMVFNLFDKNTSDFFVNITREGVPIDNIGSALITLAVLKPGGSTDSQFLEIKGNRAYCNLKPGLKDTPGTYTYMLSVICGEDIVIVGPDTYTVEGNEIISKLNKEVSADERFTLLTDMLSRLSVIETNENTRIKTENDRIEAEKLREQAIEKIKRDIESLITDTKKEISDYKSAKDTAINDDLSKYKEATTQSIDNYKSAKDTEINNILREYKSSTTKDIEEFKNTKSQELDDFKNTKNTELDNYKREKDLAINQNVENKNLALNEYVRDKNKEIDAYKTSKDKEIDLYKENKDTLINNKIKEVESAKQNIVSTANNKISELDQAKTNMQNSVNSKIEEADNRISELQNFETQLEHIESKNVEQDTRLKEIEYKNKVQDTYVKGLFNENNDGRLSIEGEGNSLKLEGSKKGLVEVEKVVGNTLVNIMPNIDLTMPNVNNGTALDYYGKVVPLVQNNKTYTLKIFNNPCITEIYITMYGMSWTALTNDCATFTVNYTNYNSEDARNIQFKTTRVLTADELSNLKIVLVEGNIPPIEYFEGMQSTFEDCKVTQEMVESGEELAENLGKYKCNVKIRGKNLFDTNLLKPVSDSLYGYYEFNPKGKQMTLSITDKDTSVNISELYLGFSVRGIDAEGGTDWLVNHGSTFGASQRTNVMKCISFYPNKQSTLDKLFARFNFQLEEGGKTDYEPYYERTQTVYLNSPPHKGDEIVCKEDGLYHYHKMGKELFDGSIDESWVKADTNWWGIPLTNCSFSTSINTICDKLIPVSYDNRNTMNSVYCGSENLYTRVVANSLSEYKQWLQDNPIAVIYELAEPYYEKISDEQIVLEIPNNATLSVESVIPCQNISATYTGNVPSVYGLEETGITNTNDIAVTQTAVDFLLMSSMGEIMMMSFKNNTKGGNNMGAYFASRIMKKALKYEDVIRKYPEFKEDIDFILRSEGYGDLIVEVQ